MKQDYVYCVYEKSIHRRCSRWIKDVWGRRFGREQWIGRAIDQIQSAIAETETEAEALLIINKRERRQRRERGGTERAEGS